MKKTILVLLTLSLLTTAFVGCASSPDDTPKKPAATTATAPDTENPASDFEYKENNENSKGGIAITKYVGTDTDVIIPSTIDGKTVTVIGQLAFNGNDTITSVIMPDSITMIGTGSFSGCDLLSTVVLSNSLEQIDYEAFASCKSLSNITLPDSLTHIGEHAFMNCKSLKHITIPANCFNSVATGSGIFSRSGLETVEFAEGVPYIPRSAFFNTNLKEVVIPDSVTHISEGAFQNCEKLEKVTLSKAITSIEGFAFENTNLKEVVIPGSIKYIFTRAFADCANLTSITYNGTEAEWNAVEKGTDWDNKTPDYTIHYQ